MMNMLRALTLSLFALSGFASGALNDILVPQENNSGTWVYKRVPLDFNVTTLQDVLDAKAALSHTHLSADITDATASGYLSTAASKVAKYDALNCLGALGLTLWTDSDDTSGGIQLVPTPDDATYTIYLPTPLANGNSIAYQEWAESQFAPLSHTHDVDEVDGLEDELSDLDDLLPKSLDAQSRSMDEFTAIVPSDVTGSVCWLNEKSPITFNASSFGNVSQWNSLIGSTHATQSTLASQPVVMPAGRHNGRRSFYFDGGDHFTVNTTGTSATAGTWLVVFAKYETSNYHTALWCNAVSAGFGASAVSDQAPSATSRATGFPLLSGFLSTYASTPAKPLPARKAHVLSLTWQKEPDASGSGRVRAYVDGMPGQTGSPMYGGLGTIDFRATSIGYSSSGSQLFFGQIMEFAQFDRSLTLAQVRGLEKTLVKKWNLEDYVAHSCIVCEGDSITAGGGAIGTTDLWWHKMGWELGVSPLVCAVGGNKIVDATLALSITQQATVEVDPHAAAGSVLILFAGTNDISSGASGATTLANLTTYVNARLTAGFGHVVIGTMLPRTGISEVERGVLNTGIRALDSGSTSITAADFDLDANLSDSTNLTYYSDGTHPTAAGQTIVGARVKTVLLDNSLIRY